MSKSPRPKLKTSSLKRVTANTQFFIDYEWWEKSQLDLKTYLVSRLSIEDESAFDTSSEEVDLVNPNTGEVHRVDGFQYVVQTYFSKLPDDFLTRASLVDAVFCVLLANANQPMTGAEIAEKSQRPVDVILKTIGGPKIYQGIRPVID